MPGSSFHPFAPRRAARRGVLRRSGAYTLLEAALVVLMTGTLLAIGVWGFGGADTHVADRTAQAAADAVLNAAADSAGAQPTAPSLAALADRLPGEVTALTADDAADDAGEVSVDLTATDVAVAAYGSDGSCWFAYTAFTASPGAPLRRYAVAPAPRPPLRPCTAEHLREELADGTSALNTSAKGDRWSAPVPLW